MEANEKTVLITGATSGIGHELAKLFANDKYRLILVGRYEETLKKTSEELQSEFGVQVSTIAKDLFLKESAFEIYDQLKTEGARVDVLVNDAGQGEYGEFMNTNISRELDIIQLNISSPVTLTKLFLADMISRDEGKILNVGSIAGEAPGPYQSVYHGTKAFINSWTAAIRNELQDTNIVVTVLLPGATDTDFFHKASMEESKILDTKLSDPSEVAKDGYKALMSDTGKVTSGLKNKAMVGMMGMMPDAMAAENFKKQQEPKQQE